jgi:hypothetical protein
VVTLADHTANSNAVHSEVLTELKLIKKTQHQCHGGWAYLADPRKNMDKSRVNDAFWIDRQHKMEDRSLGRLWILPVVGEPVDLVTDDVEVILLAELHIPFKNPAGCANAL